MLEIRAKARRLHSQCEGGLGLIIIDYLQLMRTDSRYDSRVTAVGELSRGLKILARELGVPVIALSQLSRAVEQRPDKKPQLSDLRESGNLEQDSDLVMFIYRDEYYDEDSERPGEADLIIAKHRNGAVGKVTLTFQKEYPKFMNYAGETLRAVSADAPCSPPASAATPTAVPARPVRRQRLRGRRGHATPPRDCRCRAARIAAARTRAWRAAIPRRYRGVSFDRPPVSDIARVAPEQVQSVRRYVRDDRARTSTPAEGCGSMGDVGTGKTTLAMLVSKAALEAGRSVAIYSLPRLLNLLRESRSSTEAGCSTSSTGSPRWTCCTSTTSAPRTTTDWVLEQLYSIVNARYEAERAIVATTNLMPDELSSRWASAPSRAW